jgi:crotonobetainyl-CoA:carnitine CoA-transferase CaiB-like acyl-CoA transferase
MQPLAGLVVLDFSTLLPGPLASLMLAEAGAEVIKIERPGGEEMRSFPPQWDGESAAFALLNRGKKVVTLDLKTTEGRGAVEPLLARADILIEQFRPGVMDRLDLGFERLHKQ